MTNTLQVGKRYRFYNHENVGLLGTVFALDGPEDNPRYVIFQLHRGGIFKVERSRITRFTRIYQPFEEFERENDAKELTVGELIKRLQYFPEDLVLTTDQYDYYVGVIITKDTHETIWKA